jgi:hypothetical protein
MGSKGYIHINIGRHVGTFGEMPWSFSDTTLGKLPKDLQQALDEEVKENENISKQESNIKKKILNTWKSAMPQGELEKSGETDINGNLVEVMKIKAMKAHIARSFKEKWQNEKNKADWQINPDLVHVKNSKV